MHRALLIGYHFPPLAGSSGIQRMLRFVQQLPRFGWQPLVLSAHPMAYERVDEQLLADIPPDVPVQRAWALDTARHLSLRGRHIGALARPDRWMTWRFDGVRRGREMLRRWQPKLIWSTYPIASAHAIALALHRSSGLPWVADFRDPMAQPGYPADPKTWQSFDRLERAVIESAAWSVFTTPGAVDEYRRRYPARAERIVLLENGYDEASFQQAEAALPSPEPLHAGLQTWLHSGIVYPSERDPGPLFEALKTLHQEGVLRPERHRIRFRAAVHEGLLRGLAEKAGVQGCVEILPAIAYRQALQEMLRADALMVMQADNCNQQIPAKLYEYLRAGRPIAGLCDPAGDTAATLVRAGVRSIAKLEDAGAIAALLRRALQQPQALDRPEPEAAHACDRLRRTEQLARHFTAAAGTA